MDYEAQSHQIVDNLIACKINLLALDFDQTIISEHTGGRFLGTVEELASTVRPLFLSLIPLCLSRGVHVSVVTFSPQTEMIYSVLRLHFSDQVASQIPIRGNDNSWNPVNEIRQPGKQDHMASAVHELCERFSKINNSQDTSACANVANISRRSTLLIDDDIRNIQVAIRNSVPAIHLNIKQPDKIIDDLLNMNINHLEGFSDSLHS